MGITQSVFSEGLRFIDSRVFFLQYKDPLDFASIGVWQSVLESVLVLQIQGAFLQNEDPLDFVSIGV